MWAFLLVLGLIMGAAEWVSDTIDAYNYKISGGIEIRYPGLFKK